MTVSQKAIFGFLLSIFCIAGFVILAYTGIFGFSVNILLFISVFLTLFLLFFFLFNIKQDAVKAVQNTAMLPKEPVTAYLFEELDELEKAEDTDHAPVEETEFETAGIPSGTAGRRGGLLAAAENFNLADAETVQPHIRPDSDGIPDIKVVSPFSSMLSSYKESAESQAADTTGNVIYEQDGIPFINSDAFGEEKPDSNFARLVDSVTGKAQQL